MKGELWIKAYELERRHGLNCGLMKGTKAKHVGHARSHQAMIVQWVTLRAPTGLGPLTDMQRSTRRTITYPSADSSPLQGLAP